MSTTKRTTLLQKKITMREEALDKLYDAYIALVKGGVKSYMIDDRQLTRFDISALKDEISEMEEELDSLYGLADGARSRKAFAILPRDF